MPIRPENIQSVDDARLWAVEHGTQIDAWWEAQHKWNAVHDRKFRDIEVRVTHVEKRNIFLAGFGTAIAALATALLAMSEIGTRLLGE